jgi:hypothetical protein
LVPSSEDIRRAIFQTLSGPDPYEVVDGNGEALAISSLDELSIGSMELSLRKASSRPATGTPQADNQPAPGSSAGQEPTAAANPGQSPDTKAHGPEYRRYQLDVPNRSLADPDARRGLANLLQAVLDAVDPDTGGDLQLLDLQLNLTADSTAVEEIEQRSAAIGVSWTAEELDF